VRFRAPLQATEGRDDAARSIMRISSCRPSSQSKENRLGSHHGENLTRREVPEVQIPGPEGWGAGLVNQRLDLRKLLPRPARRRAKSPVPKVPKRILEALPTMGTKLGASITSFSVSWCTRYAPTPPSCSTVQQLLPRRRGQPKKYE
jgi:hypothetical protein